MRWILLMTLFTGVVAGLVFAGGVWLIPRAEHTYIIMLPDGKMVTWTGYIEAPNGECTNLYMEGRLQGRVCGAHYLAETTAEQQPKEKLIY